MTSRAQRHWRLSLALCAHRIERRLGRHLTEFELDQICIGGDPLQLRELWLRYGGYLELQQGRLCLSAGLRRRT